MEEVYLETDCYEQSNGERNSEKVFFRVRKGEIIKLGLFKYTIKKVKRLDTSYDLLPSNKKRFEEAKQKIINYINTF